MISDVRLRESIADRWGLAGAAIERHDGGMNSATWFVSDSGRRWVAKAVHPAAGDQLAGGLAVAAALTTAGIPAGAPVPTRGGSDVAIIDGYPVALLAWVPGEPLAGRSPDDQRLIGSTLARVHAALREAPVRDPEPFVQIDLTAEHLAVRPWVRSSVAAAVAAYDDLGPASLTHGLLHTDPAPEAFRVDRTSGVCGLIDWAVAMAGPLLYDLASAVMYTGGPDRARPLVQAYLDRAVLPCVEVERGLLAMLRFRFAVQAHYFAHRIATGDLTGITGAAENEVGLADARRGLAALSD